GVDDRTLDARWNLQRRVPDFARLLAEDRAQQLLFRGELGLAFRGDLADEDIARTHFRSDANDAALVEVLQSFLADVRDVAGDFLRTQLGIAGDALEFLNVNRGEAVFLHHPFADQ